MTRRIAFVSFVLGVLVTSLLTAAPPASADTVHKTKILHEGYSRTGTIRMLRPNVCLKWKFNGLKSYRAHYKKENYAGQPATYTYVVEDMTLEFNLLTVQMFAPEGSKCPNTTRKRWDSIKLQANARGFQCSWDPSVSLSAGIPFSFGIGFELWRNCEDRAHVFLSKESVRRKNVFKLANDEQRVRLDSYQEKAFGDPAKVSWKCVGVNFGVEIELDFTNTVSGPPVRICPNWNGDPAALS